MDGLEEEADFPEDVDAVASFSSMLIVAFGVAEETATQVSAIIMAGASVLGYIIGEGLADAAHAGKTIVEVIQKPEENE